ncbi:Oligopeptide transporter [Wickerhamomyces ciferrii]|uniref:Oligopeptide transporter n=1 Tax=Wickerhamomyces ciferrii (strain ATCC 14091 / BCRC 22168 / CBS 111 / JCM 3599 / NBRC 0793 / NRRL Y-1031 F-60-10) TaxID=1206466 RepID=K0KEU7_WICCF|nr:Oligopeptide transporter [Wickerhamomyces ciferrii]CCH41466.1 Oligopeptide transporter [Wickerhamomyces ciferrii]
MSALDKDPMKNDSFNVIVESESPYEKYHQNKDEFKDDESQLFEDSGSSFKVAEAIDITNSDVDAIVPTEDYEGDANTIRMWILAIVLGTVITGVDSFFQMRFPTIHIGAIVSLVIAYPIGQAWYYVIPNWKIPLPFGYKIQLNPGPFNQKEHACIFLFVNYVSSAGLVNNSVVEQFKFFKINIGIDRMLLFQLSSFLYAYCLTGLTLSILVKPKDVVWPGVLSTCALFKAFHNKTNEPAGNWTISRFRFFSYVFCGSFIWYWFPDLILPFLSTLGAWITWIKPDSATLSQVFGVNTGLGLFPLTLDWTQITSLNNPLSTPFWSVLSVFISFVFWIWIVMPALYYQNKWQTAHFPIMTSSIFNTNGTSYLPAKVVDKDYRLDLEKFKKYSPVMLPIAFLMNLALGLAAFSSMMVTFFVKFKSDVIQPLKNPEEDSHTRALSKYKTFHWGFYVFWGIVGLGLGFAFFEGFHHETQLRADGFIVSVIMSTCIFIPLALIESRSNFEVSLAPFFEIIAAFWFSGKPIALMYFYMMGFGTMQHAMHASMGAKVGHYMKVPPKTVMTLLLFGSIWGALVSPAVTGYILNHFENICTTNAKNHMICRKSKTQFNNLVVWGLFGKHIFAKDGRYSWVLWFFLVGALFAIVMCALQWKYPKSSLLSKLNPTLFFGGAGTIPTVTGFNYSTWFFVGFILNFWIHRKKHAWWKKYNLVLAVGLDCGVAIAAILIYFCVVYTGGSENYKWWGTTVAKAGCDAKGCPHLPKGSIVAPEGWSHFDTKNLEKFFSSPNLPKQTKLGPQIEWSPLIPPLSIKQFKFGQSNPTYLITDSKGTKAVLRKKPTSNKNLISKTAHAIEREFHMLASIKSINVKNSERPQVPIASVFLLCEDESHIDAVFYVMQFVKGRIFHDPSLSAIKSQSERKKIWDSVLDTASAIHSIPSDELFDQLPSNYFRKPNKESKVTYFQRQARSLSKIQSLQAKDVDPIPFFEEITKWLLRTAPKDPKVPTLIHGDFKIDNFVFHPTKPEIIAVLDWELCTNGHPLFDLANVLQPFCMSPELNRHFSKFDINQDPALVQQVLKTYISKAHPEWDPIKLWNVGVVFGLYRVAVICQGIAQRVVRGVASSAEAKQTAALYPHVGKLAFELTKSPSKL